MCHEHQLPTRLYKRFLYWQIIVSPLTTLLLLFTIWLIPLFERGLLALCKLHDFLVHVIVSDKYTYFHKKVDSLKLYNAMRYHIYRCIQFTYIDFNGEDLCKFRAEN